MVPSREIYWNITGGMVVYVLSIVAIAILAYGLYRHYRLWMLGKEENRMDNIGERIKSLLLYGIAQTRSLRELYPGIMHIMIFGGFLVLFLGSGVDAADYYLGLHFLQGKVYQVFSLILDIAGILAIAGILMAFFRRYILRPDRLDSVLDDAIILTLILFILVTGFLIEGFRIAAEKPAFEVWSIGGWFTAKLFGGMERNSLLLFHQISWWVHMIISIGFIAYIPFSKLIHIFTSSANIFFRSLKPKGAINPILDFEEAESFGVANIKEFTWKQLLDLDACTGCGRCQDNCPAYLSKKPLSPKKIILDMKDHLLDHGKTLVKGNGGEEAAPEPLIGKVIEEEELWACTSCRSCQEQCPVFVEHLEKIVDLRKYMVLMESKFPSEVQTVFKNMENNSNPWGIGWASRADWAKDLGIKILEEDSNVDILFYVGCSGSFDDRYKKVSTSLVNIMKAAGVNFGILGKEEKCCGDSARRVGNEYLYQMLAQENIELFKKYNIKKIVTACPHGYNTLKEEYPQFGGEFEVVHHTEFILDLIKQGKLKVSKKIEGRLTYHDSCYLGRYHEIYQAPRDILGAVGSGINEMGRNKSKSFCCGAGGGRMWMEEDIGDRINEIRVEDALQTNANIVATACPFCLTMFEDGLKAKNKEGALKVMDIAEMVEKAL